MWLMTRYGFFSAVCARGENGGPHNELVMIRARDKAHLIELRKAFNCLKDAKIKETGTTDYPCHMFVRRPAFRQLLALLADDVDYTNFKSMVHEDRPKWHLYATFLHKVWGLGLALSPTAQKPHTPAWKTIEQNGRDLWDVPG